MILKELNSFLMQLIKMGMVARAGWTAGVYSRFSFTDLHDPEYKLGRVFFWMTRTQLVMVMENVARSILHYTRGLRILEYTHNLKSFRNDDLSRFIFKSSIHIYFP